jgi:hypothetical protein
LTWAAAPAASRKLAIDAGERARPSAQGLLRTPAIPD